MFKRAWIGYLLILTIVSVSGYLTYTKGLLFSTTMSLFLTGFYITLIAPIYKLMKNFFRRKRVLEPYNEYRERVDFQKQIGIWKDKSGRGLDADTCLGIIHYGKKGAYIVPSNPHKDGNFMDIGHIRSSIQVALLGQITSNLRAISLDCNKNEIKTFFYYNKRPFENDREIAN